MSFGISGELRKEGDIVAHALFEIGERQKILSAHIHAEIRLNLCRQLFVGECQHAAVGMVEHDDFACAQ